MHHEILTQSDIDAAITGLGAPGWWRTLIRDCNRHKSRNHVSRLLFYHVRRQNKQTLARQTPPPRKLMREKIVAPRDINNPRTGLKTLRHNPRLHIIRPTPVAMRACDNFATPAKTFSTIRHENPLKSAKGRIPNISQSGNPQNQWDGNGAYHCAAYQQSSDVALPHFGNSPQPLFAAGRMLLWD
jgi:hypothetical protein